MLVESNGQIAFLLACQFGTHVERNVNLPIVSFSSGVVVADDSREVRCLLRSELIYGYDVFPDAVKVIDQRSDGERHQAVYEWLIPDIERSVLVAVCIDVGRQVIEQIS